MTKLASIDIAVIDFEACDLGAETWPIEAGWIRWCDLEPRSLLIRPHSSFQRDLWSMASQRIHGVGLAALDRDGADARFVFAALTEELGDFCVVSDNPAVDSAWLGRLCRACDKPPPFAIVDLDEAIFRIGDALSIRPHVAVETFRKAIIASDQPPHRAGPDAARLMKALRAIASSA